MAIKKLWISILLLLTLILVPVTVQAEPGGVWDLAGLFTQEDITVFETQIRQLEAEYEQSFAILTTKDIGNKTAKQYAEDFFAAHNLGLGKDNSGILLLLDMDTREIYIVTAGISIRYLTDQRIEETLDAIFPHMKSQAYPQAVSAFFHSTEMFLKKGIPLNQYNYDIFTKQISKYVSMGQFYALLILAVGIIAAAITGPVFYFRTKKSYTLQKNRYQYPFSEKSALNLSQKEDLLIDKKLTSQYIPPVSHHSSGSSSGSSGGRSSTSSHSSGRSFGGGGRKF